MNIQALARFLAQNSGKVVDVSYQIQHEAGHFTHSMTTFTVKLVDVNPNEMMISHSLTAVKVSDECPTCGRSEAT